MMHTQKRLSNSLFLCFKEYLLGGLGFPHSFLVNYVSRCSLVMAPNSDGIWEKK